MIQASACQAQLSSAGRCRDYNKTAAYVCNSADTVSGKQSQLHMGHICQVSSYPWSSGEGVAQQPSGSHVVMHSRKALQSSNSGEPSSSLAAIDQCDKWLGRVAGMSYKGTSIGETEQMQVNTLMEISP